MTPRRFEAAVPAEARNLKLLRAFFDGVLAQAGVAGVADLLLALDEASANVVRHRSAAADDGMIRVRAELEPDRLRLRVLRFCAAADLDGIRPHECTEERRGGFGMGLIERIMDRVEFVRDPAPPHLVDLVMTKVLGAAEQAR